MSTSGRRTRGIKIDFTNKRLPGEKEGIEDDEEEDEENTKEEEVPAPGKGKGRAGEKSSSDVGGSSSSKPVNKA